MKKSHLLLLTSMLIVIGINLSALAQDVKKDTKLSAKVQQSTSVSIFQVNFAEVDQDLQRLFTKNETILHFRQELNTNVFMLYLPEGKNKTDLINFLKSNGIEQFEVIRFQQGVRKVNLFNKRF